VRQELEEIGMGALPATELACSGAVQR